MPPRNTRLIRSRPTGKTGSVIKAQVLAGGRGKGHFDNGLQGGVHLVQRCVTSRVGRCSVLMKSRPAQRRTLLMN